MKYRIFLLLYTFIFAVPVFSQKQVEEDYSVHTDGKQVNADSLLEEVYTTDNTISPRVLSTNIKEKYTGDEFTYDTKQAKETLWEKLKKKIKKIWFSIFGEPDPKKANHNTILLLRLLAFVFVGVILYYFIIFLLKKEGNLFFSKRKQPIPLNVSNINEDIHEINFSQKIHEFEVNRNFRFALRYRFLEILKLLSDKKIIDWNPEKTNNDYISEIQILKTKKQFEDLVFIFNNVWYGEFLVDEKEYNELKSVFQKNLF